MARWMMIAAGCALAAGLSAGGARAETVMQQCGQKYQAAKAAGTLNGMTWNQFRTDCAAKLKAEPADATTPAATAPATAAPAATAPATAATPAPAPAATTTVANPLNPASAAATAEPATPAASATGGRTAMHERQKQCGAEWRAQKATLVAQTPGLTWPKYWHQCNTRLKAAGK